MRTSGVKVTASVAIVIVALVLTVILSASASPETRNSGILIDFGEGQVLYTPLDPESYPDPSGALDYAGAVNGISVERDDAGITSIDGVSAQDGREWSLFAVLPEGKQWTILSGDPTSYSLSDYTIMCWGYCAEDESPSVAVDGTGWCIYGYSVPDRIVTVAPSSTETVCAVGGLDRIVGTDQYSNYPQGVVDGQNDGTIAFVGGYTNPSYEMILRQDPDMVFVVSNQAAHVEIASSLRSHGIDVVVLDGGDSVEAVLDNMFMAGTVLGNADLAVDRMRAVESGMGQVRDTIESDDMAWSKRVMIALSAVQSPWVSGSATYISDVLTLVDADNIYSGEAGWVQVNAETIAKYDPEVIIVVSSDYDATLSDYESMISSMSSEWRVTSAYRSGEIYLLSGDACDLISRPGPRVAEITELLGRIIHSGSFTDGTEVPKYVGDEYGTYLTITREEGS